jgi:hypothetical protein
VCVSWDWKHQSLNLSRLGGREFCILGARRAPTLGSEGTRRTLAERLAAAVHLGPILSRRTPSLHDLLRTCSKMP